MNQTSETDITRVLHALRDTHPTDGLEGRILRAIEHRTAAPSRWLPWPSSMQWSIAALATAAIVLAISLITHNTQHPASTAQSLVPTSTATTFPPKENVILSSAKDLLPARTHTNSGHPPHEPLCDCDRLALEETQAPSHPAPPLPLTPDERILVRAAQRGELVQVAELEPLAVTPKQDGAIKHVVQRFLQQIASAEDLNPTTPDSNNQSPENPN